MSGLESPTETSRLLANNDHANPSASASPTRTLRSRIPPTAVLLASFYILCVSGQGSLVTAPTTKLLEDILCRSYYKDIQHGLINVDEEMCKIDQIQSHLAYLLGFITTFEDVIGVIVTIPYGLLADKIGRRPVLILATAGVMLSLIWNLIILRFSHIFPVYLTLFSPTFQILGGNSVIVSLIYSMVADTMTEANRGGAFLFMAVSSYVGSVTGSVVASRLMEVSSPWTPILISFVIVLFGVSAVLFIPETVHKKSDDDDDDDLMDVEASSFSLRNHIKQSAARFTDSLRLVKSPSAILLLFAFTSATPVGLASGAFYIQYFSKRFHWSLAQAGYLLSVRGVTSVVFLLAVLPVLTSILQSLTMSFRLPALQKDLVLARWSAIMSAMGAFLMAGPTVPIVITGDVVLTFGGGLISLCRSVIASLVEPEHTSSLFTLVSVVETVAGWVSGPGLAWLFTLSMKHTGILAGLPYLVLSFYCAVIAIALQFVTLPSSPSL